MDNLTLRPVGQLVRHDELYQNTKNEMRYIGTVRKAEEVTRGTVTITLDDGAVLQHRTYTSFWTLRPKKEGTK